MKKSLVALILLGSSFLSSSSIAQEGFFRRITGVQTAEYRFPTNQNRPNMPVQQPPTNPVNERGVPYYQPGQPGQPNQQNYPCNQNYPRIMPQARPASGFQNPYDKNIRDPAPMDINSPEFKEHQNDLREYYFPNNPELHGNNYGKPRLVPVGPMPPIPQEFNQVPSSSQNNQQVPDNPYPRYQQWYGKIWSDSFDRMQKSQDPRYSPEERQMFIDQENEARSRFNSEDAKWQAEISRFNQYIESQRQKSQLPTIQNQNIENRTIIIHGNNNRVYQR
jgi:hypothetical protein